MRSSTVIAGMSLPRTRRPLELFRLAHHHRYGVVLDLDLESGLAPRARTRRAGRSAARSEPDPLAAPSDPGDGAMGTDVEEGCLGEIDRHGAHAPTTCVRQQAGRPPIELPRNVEHTLPPFDAHRRRRREACSSSPPPRSGEPVGRVPTPRAGNDPDRTGIPGPCPLAAAPGADAPCPRAPTRTRRPGSRPGSILPRRAGEPRRTRRAEPRPRRPRARARRSRA